MHIVDTPGNDPFSFSGGLEHPDLSRGVLRPLINEIRSAVRSYVGLSVTLVNDGCPVIVTTVTDAEAIEEIGASLRLPLTMVADVEDGSAMIVYAGTPGAFVDLAADVSYALNISLDTVVLDQHLTPPQPAAGITGTRDFTDVNQAIGILIAQGDTPDEARAYLRLRAHHNHTGLAVAARDVKNDQRNLPDTA